jgi:signal transduction histidine kinase
MGTHGAATTRSRAISPGGNGSGPVGGNLSLRWLDLGLERWPVARRLFAVIVAALLMGLVFGGLRVATAESSASQFSRTQQLATLNAQLVTLVEDLQNERAETLLLFSSSAADQQRTLAPYFAKTDAAAAAVQATASGLSGLPANIQADNAEVLADISSSGIQALHSTLSSATDDTSAVDSYAADITDMITLADQVGQGVSDAALSGDVEALDELALAKEQMSQQEALLNYGFTSPDSRQVTYDTGSGTVTSPHFPTVDPATEEALAVAYAQQYTDLGAFNQAADSVQAQNYVSLVESAARGTTTDTAVQIENNVFFNTDTDYFSDNGQTDTGVSVPGSQLSPSLTDLTLEPGAKGSTLLQRGLDTWDTGLGDELTAMQSVETTIADNITTRAAQLHQSAQRSALTFGVLTLVVLLVVLLAALAVARSLVLPLNRLRLGALDIAEVQLPERVRMLSESPDAAESMEVAPIDVASGDEIGEVARAFDRVHSEAVRLAAEQALLRSSFNAMFVNLSRRSQTLIERLARMIDGLEQSEDDPDRLGSLFSMDHLITRMRRNSENTLLLAGHDNPRKWSEPVPIADVARAATSEIEQYNRVTLNIASDVAVSGQAASDVVHLLAELIENATIYSSKDTTVRVSTQELASGGALIEIVDKGIGISEARLTDINWRLDNPPMIDVSVSRHMGLFAVARLAKRHRVRVRLRPASPQGLSALVWLPDNIVERNPAAVGSLNWSAQLVGARSGDRGALAAAGAGPVGLAAGNGSGHGNGHGNGGGLAIAGENGLGNSDDLADRRAASGWFRGGQDAGEQPGPGGTADFASAAADPAFDGRTASGLPTRKPKANLPPGPVRGGTAALAPGGGRGAETGGAASLQRSPEQVRNRLAGFQRGNQRAQRQGRDAARSGEGTER